MYPRVSVWFVAVYPLQLYGVAVRGLGRSEEMYSYCLIVSLCFHQGPHLWLTSPTPSVERLWGGKWGGVTPMGATIGTPATPIHSRSKFWLWEQMRNSSDPRTLCFMVIWCCWCVAWRVPSRKAWSIWIAAVKGDSSKNHWSLNLHKNTAISALKVIRLLQGEYCRPWIFCWTRPDKIRT